MSTKIRYGMVGGGKGADIGPVHRVAARLDNEYELVCGAFSRDPENSKETGKALGIEGSRVYASYVQMLQEEALLPAEKRVQVVSIVTPNDSHFEIAKLALLKGFHVFCEKPLTFNLAQAQELQQLSQDKHLLFGVDFTKAGFPMVKQMQAMVQSGRFGKIKKITVDYRGSEFDAAHSHTKQAKWRIDPKQSGPTGTLGDIGSHAFHLAEYVTGLKTVKLLAYMNTIMYNRPLDDDNTVILQFSNGASGVLTACQALPGERENLSFTLYGETGGVKWNLLYPDELEIYSIDQPIQILRLNMDSKHLDAAVFERGRIPGGANEGHFGAMANHYLELAKAIRASASGTKLGNHQFPDIDEGVRNMAFLEAALKSASAKNQWVDF